MSETPPNSTGQPYPFIEARLVHAAARIIKTARVLEGHSLTQTMTNVIGVYDYGLKLACSEQSIIASRGNERRYITVPASLPPDIGEPTMRLRVNIHPTAERVLEMSEMLTGFDRNTTVNVAILYYNEIASAPFSGYTLRVSPDPTL